MNHRLGIISDLHADLGALEDALDNFDRLGVDEIVCAGDIVDGGDEPEAVIALLRERRIPTVRGNHDRWALMRHDSGEPEHEGDARSHYLSVGAVEWLAGLPTNWRKTIEGVRLVVVHGTPLSDMDGIYPGTSGAELESWLAVAEADVLVCGHTHIPLIRHVAGSRLLVNPGALWRDAGASPSTSGHEPCGGCCGVLELPGLRWLPHQVR